MDQPARPVRQRQDRLLAAIMGTTILLAAALAVGITHQGAGPRVVEMPFFVPAISATAGLAGLGVAFMVLGRYRVLRDAPAFWIGLCFGAQGILYLFYLLTWPGARADGQGIIARLPSTSAWIGLLQSGAMATLLLVAAVAEWPRAGGRVSRRWLPVVIGWGALWVIIGLLVVALEDQVAALNISKTQGRQVVLWLFILVDGAGAALAAHRYLQTGWRLLAYVALASLWALGSGVASLRFEVRYDLWWYLFRLLALAPILIMLYGVLAEYVGLFRRERERSEELQRQRALLEAVLNQMPAGVLIAEAPSGRLLMHTRQEEQPIYGLSIDPKAGQEELGPWLGHHPDGRPYLPHEWPLDRALRQGEVVHDEEVHVDRADGTRGIIAVSAAPVRDSQGRIIAAVAICRDMTQSKRSEQALRESEERYRAVYQQAAVGIERLDAQGRMIEVNAMICQILGYGLDELLGRSYLEITHPDDREDDRTVMEELWKGAVSSYVAEKRYLAHDGRPVWVRITSSLARGEEGEPLYRVSVVEDITARRKAEEDLQQAARALQALNETLEQRVRERTALAEQRARQLRALAAQLVRAEERERRRLALLLHDHLQQLLAAAILQLNMAQRRVSAEAQAALKPALDLVSEALQSSRSLTAELSPTILHDAGLVPALHWLARWVQANHGLQVTVDAPEEPNVIPIPEEMAALLFHSTRELLFNVVKHAGVDCAELQLAYPAPDTVRLVVSDQGRGMDYTQERNGTEAGGFGLLSIRERLAYVGGEFEVQSAPGQGTRIIMTLPLREKHPDPPPTS